MVSVRKAKKAEKKLATELASKKQNMSLDEAYRLVDNIYKTPDATIDWRELDKALSIIGASDARFAADMKKDFELREAYQIAGGYYQYGHNALQKTMDKRFDKAIKLIEADDPEFAQTLQSLHDMGTSFKQATPEQMVQNAKDLSVLCGDEELINTVREDEEVRGVFQSSPVQSERQDEAEEIVINSAVQDVITNSTEDANFAEADAEEKRNMFVTRLKKAVKWNVFKARVQSLGSSIAHIKDALSFKKKVPVSVSAIANGFKRSTERFGSYISNIAKKGQTAAAAWLNKTKAKIGQQAIRLATFSLLFSSAGCTVQRTEARADMSSPETTKNITLNSVQPSAAIVTTLTPTDSINAAEKMVSQKPSVKITTTTASVSTTPVTPADTISTTVSGADTFMAQFMAVKNASTDSVSTTHVATADTVSTNVSDADAFMAQFMAAKNANTGSVSTTPVTPADTVSVSDDHIAEFMNGFNNARIQAADSVATDSVQIVTDSDSIPLGTPAAGYVAERGGYENRGVGSKKQYMNLRSKIQSTLANEWGENAYDLAVEHINNHPDVFRSKGCIGEGWTADQILQGYITMRGAPAGYGKELEVLGRLLNPRGCDMNVSVAEMGQINEMLSHSNADNLRDGVLYSLPTVTTGLIFDQCNQTVTQTIENTGQTNIKPNRTNGVKHPEYYMLYISKPVKAEPAYTVDRDTVYTTTYTDSLVAPEITLHKGSEMNPEAPGSQNLGTVDAEILQQDLSDNTKVLVAQEGSQTEASSVKAPKKKTTKAKKGGKKKSQYSYDDLTDAQKAARLAAARETVRKWRGY